MKLGFSTVAAVFLSLVRVALASITIASSVCAGDNWPQAAGPHGNWQVEGEPPTRWSVTRNEGVRWRTSLPEAGMSGVTIWGDRVFVTTHVPIKTLEEKEWVKDIVGFCLDADTGEILWQVEDMREQIQDLRTEVTELKKEKKEGRPLKEYLKLIGTIMASGVVYHIVLFMYRELWPSNHVSPDPPRSDVENQSTTTTPNSNVESS